MTFNNINIEKQSIFTHKHKPIHRVKQGNLKYVKPALADFKHFKKMSIKLKKYSLTTNLVMLQENHNAAMFLLIPLQIFSAPKFF